MQCLLRSEPEAVKLSSITEEQNDAQGLYIFEKSFTSVVTLYSFPTIYYGLVTEQLAPENCLL